MRKMTVIPYDEAWVRQFSQEANILRELFGDELIDIHHIGSTAVPGLKTKPIIDMLPVVKDIARIDAYNEAMGQLGYVPRGEFGLEGRRYFPKGGDNRTHHVHMYQTGHPATKRHLAFRDYLRSPRSGKRVWKLERKIGTSLLERSRLLCKRKRSVGNGNRAKSTCLVYKSIAARHKNTPQRQHAKGILIIFFQGDS